MTKFKVGDKVIFNKENTHVAKQFDYKINKPYEVQEVFPFHHTVQIINEKGSSHSFDEERFELVETKPTKNQRITALENEVAELKLIVHELRDGRKTMRNVMNEVLSEPSTTNTVEDIIEFEGQQYRKVDRLAREGDAVIFGDTRTSPEYVTKGKVYKVLEGEGENAYFRDNQNDRLFVYRELSNRTPETVGVYELIKGGLNPQIPIVDETIEPLTPNQQRAAIIEKAKEFIDKHDKDTHINIHDNAIIAYKLDTADFGISKCNPSDVFNEHIGKAIALGRALGIDVSEFEQAVQPSGVVVGQVIKRKNSLGNTYVRTVREFEDNKVYYTKDEWSWDFKESLQKDTTIINDTNAIYGGVE